MKLKSLTQRKAEEGLDPGSNKSSKQKKARAGRNKKTGLEPKKQSTGEGRK